MTAQRQERYGWRPGTAAFGLLAGFFAAFSLDFAAQAATTERVVVEPLFRPRHRGLRSRRLFHRSAARRGCLISRPREAGAVWRFRNEGNRASFVAHPEIYGPQFGGYDPVDLGRGVTYAGSPRFWAYRRPAALFVWPRGEPRCIHRQPCAFPERRHRALASARTGIGAVVGELPQPG